MTLAMPQSFFDVDAAYLDELLRGALNTETICARLGALVEHLSDIAAPNVGAAKILLVMARLAARIGDAVEVRIFDEGTETALDTLVVRDASWSRPWPAVRLLAPYREFDQAVKIRPDVILPLLVAGGTEGFVLLLRSRENRDVFTISTVQMPALRAPDR